MKVKYIMPSLDTRDSKYQRELTVLAYIHRNPLITNKDLDKLTELFKINQN